MKNRSLREYSFVLGLALAAWAVWLSPTFDRSYVYTWDSAAYIDCARSILDGRGFMQRAIDGFGPEIWVPISWWPPGYPLLVALAAATGVGLPQAGVAVAVLSAALAVLVLGLVAVRLCGWALALPLTLTIVLMPAFFQISVTCMSDASYYALAGASALCLLRGIQAGRASLRWFLAAGLLAGLSWGVRNVAISLLIATGLFLLIDAIWLRHQRLPTILLAWSLGVSIGLAPFVIRNLVTFGALNGYSMPPSDLSVWQNISATATVIVHDLTGSARLESLLANGKIVATAMGVGVLLTGLLAGLWQKEPWRDFARRHAVVLFCLTWAGLHLAVVIAARTTYRWGEPVVSRHTMPTYGLLWIALGLGLPVLLQRAGLAASLARRVTIAVFVLTAARQAQQQIGYLQKTQPHSHVSIQQQFGPAVSDFLARNVRPDQIVLAHYPDLLRTHANVNSRKIPYIAQYYKLPPLTREQLNEHGRSGFLWGLVIADFAGTERGDYDELIRDIVRHPANHPEWTRVTVEGPALILKYVGAGSSTNSTELRMRSVSPSKPHLLGGG